MEDDGHHLQRQLVLKTVWCSSEACTELPLAGGREQSRP